MRCQWRFGAICGGLCGTCDTRMLHLVMLMLMLVVGTLALIILTGFTVVLTGVLVPVKSARCGAGFRTNSACNITWCA